jgi:hypothetical protein
VRADWGSPAQPSCDMSAVAGAAFGNAARTIVSGKLPHGLGDSRLRLLVDGNNTDEDRRINAERRGDLRSRPLTASQCAMNGQVHLHDSDSCASSAMGATTRLPADPKAWQVCRHSRSILTTQSPPRALYNRSTEPAQRASPPQHLPIKAQGVASEHTSSRPAGTGVASGLLSSSSPTLRQRPDPLPSRPPTRPSRWCLRPLGTRTRPSR